MIRVVLFIISIFVSLFFSESRQGIIEFVWTTLTLLLFFISFIVPKNKKLSISIPPTYSVLFLVFFIILVLSTVYSSSPAYSLSFLLRALTAWCVFALLYSIPKKERMIPLFAKGLLFVGGCVALLSLALNFFPHTIPFSSMNLIFSRTGHNQAINLLLPLFPIAFHYAVHQKNTIIKWVILVLFSLAILFCFARGAVLIALVYLFFITNSQQRVQNKKNYTTKYALLVACLNILVLLVTASFFFPIRESSIKLPFTIAYVTKSKLSEEVRLSNWQQALSGFASRPLLGTGPSTYILTSMKYHKTPNDGAGLAHNWYVQTLSEVGLLGAIPIGIILYFIVKTLRKERKIATQARTHSWATCGLIDSVFIAFLYSLIDYNLDYFTLWVLLWGTIALLLPQHKKKEQSILSKAITIGAIGMLSIYVGTNLYANIKLHTVETASQRLLFQPYDTNKTARYIEYKNIHSEPLTSKEQSLILSWHKQNPDILITLATASTILPPKQRMEFYTTALTLNPLNSYYYQSFLTFLYEQQDKERMYELFSTFIDKAYHVTNPSAPSIRKNLPKDIILPALTPELFSLFPGTANVPEIASKTLYMIGLSSLSTASTATEILWTIAKDISPDWGLFHRELASYYIYSAHDNLQAKLTLIDCQMRSSPAKACTEDLHLFPNLPEPGSYNENIRMIPHYEKNTLVY